MNDLTYTQAVAKAASLKDLGMEKVYLFDKSDAPWQHVTEVEPGGSHRLDMDTSVRFLAEDPSGLTFSWSWDIEDRAANGLGHFMIKTKECQELMAKLSPVGQAQFKKYLQTSADKVAAKAEEWHAIYKRQAQDAETLAKLAK